MRRSSKPVRTVVVVMGATIAMAWAAQARAEQFTLFDFTYEATTANTHDAHYDVKAPMYPLPQPDNWKAPIDYTQGTIYIEQDVLTKPSAEETQVDVCFLTGGYGCLNTNHYTSTGRNTTMNPVTDFWQFNQINWSKRIPLVQLIVKDKNNANGGRPVDKFMPTRMHIALTVVAKGSTYTPPPGFGASAPADGGTGPADAAAPAADAEAPGSGGVSGTGGSSGEGGASGTGGGSGTGGSGSGEGGSFASGGGTGTGGSTGMGGSTAAGGKPGAGGGTGSGGKPSTGGKGGSTPAPEEDPPTAAKAGSCSIATRATVDGALALLGLALCALAIARRRR